MFQLLLGILIKNKLPESKFLKEHNAFEMVQYTLKTSLLNLLRFSIIHKPG